MYGQTDTIRGSESLAKKKKVHQRKARATFLHFLFSPSITKVMRVMKHDYDSVGA
jgi:hypothetical protein